MQLLRSPHIHTWAVLQRLSDVGGGDGLVACQVGDGAGQLEDAVEGAGGKLEALRALADALLPLILRDGVEHTLPLAIDAVQLLSRVFDARRVIATGK